MASEPNATELAVLKVLWSAKALSAREVHTQIEDAQGWSYSTTRTVLQRMVDKGLVKKASAHGLAVFSAADSKVDLIGTLVRDFTERVLEVEGPLPVAAFTGSALLNEQELAELEALLGPGDPSDPEDRP